MRIYSWTHEVMLSPKLEKASGLSYGELTAMRCQLELPYAAAACANIILLASAHWEGVDLVKRPPKASCHCIMPQAAGIAARRAERRKEITNAAQICTRTDIHIRVEIAAPSQPSQPREVQQAGEVARSVAKAVWPRRIAEGFTSAIDLGI